MNRLKMITMALVGLLALASPAWALTAQDKADRTITDDGQTRVVPGSTTILHESTTTTSLGGSALGFVCGTVPTDKNWYITEVSYVYTGTTTNVRMALTADGDTVDQDGSPTTNEAQRFSVNLYLDEDQVLRLVPIGYTAGDDLQCQTHGIEYSDNNI